MSGTLFICGTPIGNLEDITLRCLRTLKEVDLIAAEDTRQTIKLLNHYDIKTPLTSYHEHNKKIKGLKIAEMLKSGKNIALVSDAGMPGISDPGEELIKLCYDENISLTVVPGATAVITALVLSGIDSRSYCFEGFLPGAKKQRRDIIERLRKETRTIVLYEAPHHLKNTLNELCSALGGRNAAVLRELTKKYETVNKGTISELVEYFTENEPKGEFVIVIEGIRQNELEEMEKSRYNSISIKEHMDIYLKNGINVKEAMKLVAKERGIGKREVYSYLNRENDDMI